MCAKCLVTDPVNLEQCIHCRRRRRVSSRSADGPVCATCVPRRTAICSMCGRTAPCIVSTTTGQPRCGACARSWACCSRCGQSAIVRAGTREVPLCGHCAVPDPSFWKTCPRCGADGRLTSGVCSRCHLHQQLQTLLTDAGGQISPQLHRLHETLAGVDRPTTALNWLTHATVRSVLADLASGQRPLSHAALDDLTPSKPIEHLRSVLVATAALPARDEHLARIERWVTDTLNEHRQPDEKELLHRYAVWHVLRRLRQRNHGADTTYGQLDVVRRRVRAAIGLLDWLRGRGLTLATLPASRPRRLAHPSRRQPSRGGRPLRPLGDLPAPQPQPAVRRHPLDRPRRAAGPGTALAPSQKAATRRQPRHRRPSRRAPATALRPTTRDNQSAHHRRHRHQQRHRQAPLRQRAHRAPRASRRHSSTS